MPHSRPRYAFSALERKLKFARVVTLQGARQCGKSFLVKHFLGQTHPKMVLERFDLGETRAFATENPDLFLRERMKANPLAIDEAQRVPAIFDAIKVQADENPTPGRFVLLGSTEFSHQFRIQESLTGRMSRLRLFPMTLGECLELPNTKGDLHGILFRSPRAQVDSVLTMLERGGMPGIFAVRSDEEREGLFEDWVNLTCNRDLHQIPGLRLDSDLAHDLLRAIATIEEPIAIELAKKLHVSPKVVEKHLKALETLFVIQHLKPHAAGTGKNRFYLCDVGIAHFLGGRQQRLLETWIFQELSAKRALLPAPSKRQITYYRTSKGSTLPFVVEDQTQGVTLALQARYKEKVDKRDLAIVQSFRQALGRESSKNNFHSYLLLASASRQKIDETEVLPWGALI
ncbi:AAA family ATPase [Bdellovibrionota bacterium FG-1]